MNLPDPSSLTARRLSGLAAVGCGCVIIGFGLLQYTALDVFVGGGLLLVGIWLLFVVGNLAVGLAYLRSLSYTAAVFRREDEFE